MIPIDKGDASAAKGNWTIFVAMAVAKARIATAAKFSFVASMFFYSTCGFFSAAAHRSKARRTI
jgi:hypothetical protein